MRAHLFLSICFQLLKAFNPSQMCPTQAVTPFLTSSMGKFPIFKRETGTTKLCQNIVGHQDHLQMHQFSPIAHLSLYFQLIHTSFKAAGSNSCFLPRSFLSLTAASPGIRSSSNTRFYSSVHQLRAISGQQEKGRMCGLGTEEQREQLQHCESHKAGQTREVPGGSQSNGPQKSSN